jgi:hypothetical protein
VNVVPILLEADGAIVTEDGAEGEFDPESTKSEDNYE